MGDLVGPDRQAWLGIVGVSSIQPTILVDLEQAATGLDAQPFEVMRRCTCLAAEKRPPALPSARYNEFRILVDRENLAR